MGLMTGPGTAGGSQARDATDEGMSVESQDKYIFILMFYLERVGILITS